MTRREIRFFAAAGIAILAAFGLAQPASASPGWDPVTWTGDMPCSPTDHIDGDVNVEFQACTVTSGQYMQIVAVIVNHTGHNVDISAPLVDSYINQASQVHNECVSSQLGPGSRRGCFGTTRYIPCGSAIEGWVAIMIEGSVYYPLPPDHSHC